MNPRIASEKPSPSGSEGVGGILDSMSPVYGLIQVFVRRRTQIPVSHDDDEHMTDMMIELKTAGDAALIRIGIALARTAQ
jgi:hypothetical protein